MNHYQEAEQAQLILRMAEQLKASREELEAMREIQAELLCEIRRLRHDMAEARRAMVRELVRK